MASPPATQNFWPCVQLSVQVREHIAPGAIPEHVFAFVHGVVCETNKHASPSVEHVATDCWSGHTLPSLVQIVALHLQEAVPLSI